jgi:hypothetical protein
MLFPVDDSSSIAGLAEFWHLKRKPAEILQRPVITSSVQELNEMDQKSYD